jgi:TPR repeat protein
LTRDEALDWLGRAAEQGHRSASKELAELQSIVAAESAGARAPVEVVEPERTTL